MPELVFEILSEEIPARFQEDAAARLERDLARVLKEARLAFDAIEAEVTPRRLVAFVTGLADRQPDIEEERRGPREGAAQKALEGFARAAGVTVSALVLKETPKGRFYFATLREKGQPASQVLASLLPELIRSFSWPKSMRWGEGSLRWVRPIRGILALLDDEPVSFVLDGLESGRFTHGHRFHAPQPISVESAHRYRQALENAHVRLSFAGRMEAIAAGAHNVAAEAGLKLVEDPVLLKENAGLAEWPVPMLGRFDSAFLALPEEVLITAMAHHQKVFATRDPASGRLAPAFVFVADRDPKLADATAITRGNERVLAARLADARFFWEQDRKIPLDEHLPALGEIVFHEKLGSLLDRVHRIERLAATIAEHHLPKADPALVRRAARLAKCDLVTGMVGEFPELQGTMGRYYALAQGEPAEVAQAIEEHYAPKGPADRCPSAPVSIAVALAEKIDTLVGFFGIGLPPTGSKDPFALRRAALGIIRLLLENGLSMPLIPVIETARRLYHVDLPKHDPSALLTFFAERLKVQQREKGVRHDLIDAAFAVSGDDDLQRLIKRVTALQAFLESPDGANLLIGYRRAANILRIEERKDSCSYRDAPDPAVFAQEEERALFAALCDAHEKATAALSREDFVGAMHALAALRPKVDAFFDHVTVNADEPKLRANRLRLLNAIREAVDAVADFSKIEGDAPPRNERGQPVAAGS